MHRQQSSLEPAMPVMDQGWSGSTRACRNVALYVRATHTEASQVPARKWPKEMDEVIWACMQDGMKPQAIQRGLLEDQFGLGAKLDVPYRTLQDKMGKLKRKRGNPKTLVMPGTEVSAIDAMNRQMLAITREKIEEAAAKQRSGEEFTVKELKDLDQLLKLANSIRRQIKQAEADEKKDREMVDLAKRSHESPRTDLISKIRERESQRLEEAKKRADAGADEPAPDASSEHQEPDKPRPESNGQPDQGSRPF